MREFYLQNGSGNKYSLMDINHWLYEPKNLGAKFKNKYEQFDSNFRRTQRIADPDDIEGTILFTGEDKYQKYSDFVKFIAVEPLTFIYVSNAEYKCSVDLAELEKTEIDADTSTLQCKLKLSRVSRWYKHIILDNEGGDTNGKTYDYKYDYTYTEYESQTAVIQSDSGYASPTKISIMGPCINPRWTHYLNNEIVGRGAVTCDIREGRRIVIDCTTIPYSIKEFDNAGRMTADLYQDSDFTLTRFIQLAYGKNRIYVEHDGTNTLKLQVEARLEYETV